MAEGATLDGFTVTNVGTYDDESWNIHFKTQGEEQAHEPIGQPGTGGIGVVGVTCVIKNNIVHHIGYSGIAIMGLTRESCRPHVIHNVCYRNMGGGIGCMRKSRAIVEENTCFENFYAGIGIRTGSFTSPIIENNVCYENEMAGIGAREESSPIIRGNRCYRNQLAGIGSRTKATPTIIGNTCYQNKESGIGQMSDAQTLLIGNDCHHKSMPGIGFAACKAGHSLVMNNRVVDNGLVGVGINPG